MVTRPGRTPPERIGGTRYPVEVHNLHMGEYWFAMKEYEKASDCLILKPFENPNLTLLADLLLVKIYYETESPLLEFKIKAMDQKVRRTKISTAMKDSYFNFLKILEKILKYNTYTPNTKIAKIKDEILNTSNLFSRSWLLSLLEKK